MKLNPDKCHLILITKEQTSLKIGNLNIKNSLCEKLLGINLEQTSLKIGNLNIKNSMREKLLGINFDYKLNNVFSGIENIKFVGPKIWEILPPEVKQPENLKACVRYFLSIFYFFTKL